MSKLFCLTVAPKELTTEQQASIIKLHQLSFNLDRESVLSMVGQRDRIKMYYETNHNELIGIVGIQVVELGDRVAMMYIGNAIVRPDFKRCRVLSRAIFFEAFKFYLTYFTYKKFQISAATSSEAYSFYEQIPEAWPKLDRSVPEEVKPLIEKAVQTIFHDDYYLYKNNFIITKLRIDEKFTLNEGCQNNHFTELNPHYNNGEQLVCFANVNFKNIFYVFKKYLRFLFKKRKYHENTDTSQR